jgi:hypothetical protein
VGRGATTIRVHVQVPAATARRAPALEHVPQSERDENRTVTAIPGDDESALILICDHCGRTCDNGDPPPVAWADLWRRAADAGWGGRDRAVGPHFCLRCAG